MLSGKLRLLSWVAPGDDSEHHLVDASASSELTSLLREELRNAPSARLATDQELFWLVNWMKQQASATESPMSLDLSPLLACALIKSAIFAEELHRQDTKSVQVE